MTRTFLKSTGLSPLPSPEARSPDRSDSDDRALCLPVGDIQVVARRMAAVVHARVPELAGISGRQAVLAETEAGCLACIEGLQHVLDGEVFVSDFQLSEIIRQHILVFVQRQIPLPALLRAFRIGQNHLWREMAAHTKAKTDDEFAVPGLLVRAGTVLFEYFDRIGVLAERAYTMELAEWGRDPAASRHDVITELLKAQPVDVIAASRQLDYDLEAWHIGFSVTASIETRDGEWPPVDLLAIAANVASAIGCPRPLLVPAAPSALWGWARVDKPLHDDGPAAGIGSEELPAGVVVGFGHPGEGVEGFRTSHAEARHATELLRSFGGGRDGRTVAYDDVEALSLLTADRERSLRFVQRRLRGLSDPSASILRATALSFLDHGASHTGAAPVLGVHKNTVKGRIRKAERLLEGPITTGDSDLHLALRLATFAEGPAEVR